MNLTELAQAIYKESLSKGFDPSQNHPLTSHMLMVTEIAEASECVRNGEKDSWVDDKGKPQGEAIELVDALMRILIYSGSKGWNLDALLEQKRQYNLTRSHRFGNKIV